MHQLLTWVFEPGFFASTPVRTAVVIGGVTAVVSAVVGVFTVLRGQSFAGHSLGDVSAAGGSGALLVGLTPLAGFIGLGVIGAGAMELIGIQRVRGRDLATGIVLGAAIGLAALFLYLDTSASATTGAAQQVLFGSIFTITSSLAVIISFSVLAVGAIAVIGRPLLLATVSPDIAAARGVPVRLVGLAYMLALAVAVGLSSLTVGAILSTALLIGPAATALHLADRQPERAVEALTPIHGVSRQALVELRSILGVLRAVDEDGLPRDPAPSLSHLDDLVTMATSAGLKVRVEEEELGPSLPRAVDVAAYRIVQEALTNTIKHARGATRVQVRLRYAEPVIQVDTVDNGHPRAAVSLRDPAGHGLAGMSERAALYDGTVQAGPSPGGGWAISARLSLAGRAQPAAP